MHRRTFLAAGAALLTVRPASAAAAPQRIVCVGGAITEIVFALGEGAHVIAVDTTSLYPWRAVAPLPKVGYLRQLSVEGILSTRPDLILADVDAGPKNVLDQLQSMGAPIAHFHAEHSVGSVVPKIRFVGEAIGHKPEAEAVLEGYSADLKSVETTVAGLTRHPKVLFLIAAGTAGLRGAGEGTAAAEMIVRAGGINSFAGVNGYKPVSAEAALAADPDCLLMMQQTVDELGGVNAVAMMPALAKLSAAKAKRIVALDGNYMLNFGPRTAHAIRDLAAALHPDATLPTLPQRPWTTA
ncbi:heme/hemin ABC transporter substrate-binding protein [Dongia sedimenti]|uniref:ABC transporter substrate-binding protein n=1 Tax=Dongia sedimenti TaxID=3064282 RepID=A0ABU0YGF1_9PROT|nr:ABC transporter substrate-binding protein [Rhodospirillaceae bacterium R-7]